MKKCVPSVRVLFIALLLFFSLVQLWAADYPTTVQSFNPVGYWRLSESVSPPPANILVNSGSLGAVANGFPTPYGITDPTATLLNAQPGVVGSSISFTNPGAAGVTENWSSIIDVPYNPAFNPNGPFTVEFWAKPNGHGTGADLLAPIFSVNLAKSRSGWLVYHDVANSRWEFRIGGTSSYAATVDSTNVTVTAGTWYHVVAVYDGANCLLYVNGQLSAAPKPATGGAGYAPNDASPLRIGGTTFPAYPDGNSGRTFDGWMDEIAFYAGALSGTTISNHYFLGTNNPAGYAATILANAPLGYWHMDDPVYTPPNPSTLPVTANLGTLGAAANGTNQPGLTAGIAGPPFTGFPPNNLGSKLLYSAGNVDLGSPAGLNFSNQITMIAWVKPQYTAGLRNIISHGYRNTPDQEVQMRINGGYYEVGSWSPGEGTSETTGFAARDVGSWIFLASTFDGANWNLYRYDQLISSTPGSAGALQMDDPIPSWSIGSRGDTTSDGRYFGGSIDEVAIFTNALTQSQIQSIFYSAKMSPIIITAPVPPSGTIYEGSSLSFSVVAAGNPTLLYQWTKGTTPIPGQTGTSLDLNGLTTADSGTYAIVVTNNYGSITSSFPVTVTAGPPLITTQPKSLSLFVGATAAFSSTAVGSPPLTYQWYFNTNTSIGGATGTSYSKANIQPADGGKYNLRITNPHGITNSDYSTLTVLPFPPTPYPGTALGDNPIAYWRLDESSGTVAHDSWGGHDGTYHGVTLGASGYPPDPDKAATFTGQDTYVGEIPGLDFAGASTFSLEAWVNGSASQVEGATIISKGRGANGGGGVNGLQYSLDVSAGKYRLHVEPTTGGAGDAIAGVGPNGTWQHVVGVYDAPNGVMTIYVNGVASGSSSVVPSPLASGLPTVIGAGQGGVTPIHDLYFAGTIDEVAVYSTALTASQVHTHVCAEFGFGQSPSFLVQPVSVTDYIGWPITLSASVSGSCELTYQWKKGNVNLSDGGTLTGANSNRLDITSLAPSDAGNYTLVVNNSAGTATSVAAVLTVLAVPTNSVPIPNLVMHLKFDGDLTDATGRGNNGTGKHVLFNTTTTVNPSPANGGLFEYVSGGVLPPFGTQPFALGQALHYSSDAGPPQVGTGTTVGTNDYYVTLGVRPDLKFSSNVDFSVSYWIRLPGFYDLGDLPFFCDAANSTGGNGFTFAPSYGSNGVFSAGTEANSGSWAWSVNSTRVEGPWYSINDNFWHHLIHTFNRAGNGITYLDGVQVDSRSVAAAGNISNGNAASIGQDPSGKYSETGAADIDDLGVWRRALTPLEAKTLFVAGTNSITFVDITPSIALLPGNQAQITWQSGILQQADFVTGPFTDVTPTPTSPYTISASAAKKFYRTRQ